MELLAPFKLSPFFRTRVWGWNNLQPWFDYQVDGGEPIGEVWLTGPQCSVATGVHQGENFAELVRQRGQVIVGPEYAAAGEFPLLVKVLFPGEKLSVQVHPDDRLAQSKGEPRGKTECWYVLEAKPGAELALGLEPGVSAAAVRQAIEDQTLERLLHHEPLQTGDMIFVDAGTVHAIWPGAVILETQQTSDTTYRLYDYGRPRELHVDQSLEAMRMETRAGKKTSTGGVRGEAVLLDERYFRVERWSGDAAGLSAACQEEHGPQMLFVAGGSARIEGADFEAFPLGRCELAVVPASTPQWELRGEAEVVRMLPRNQAAVV